MKEFLVGGAIRDRILGVATKTTERDYVVVDSSPEKFSATELMQ